MTERRGDLLRSLDAILGNEAQQFLQASEEKLSAKFRFNPIKHTLDFQRRLLDLEGFKFQEASVPASFELSHPAEGAIGKSLSHVLGHIYIQDLASMLPPLLLEPKPGERVLDICAAPGSKSTQIAALMGNTGVLIANEISRKRQRSLIFNLRRIGVTNAIVLNLFGEQFGNRYFEAFDRILLDPPCSALGTVHKSPEVLKWWSPSRTKKLARNQLSLMQSALKALRPGGLLLYSTCTITPEENEEIVNYAVSSFPMEVEPISVAGLQVRPGLTAFGNRVYSSQVKGAMRLYPHENPCEGFFIARLRKLGSFGESRYRKQLPEQLSVLRKPSERSVQRIISRLAEKFGIPRTYLDSGLYSISSDLRFGAADLSSFPLYDPPKALGLPLAHIRGPEPKLTTEGCHLLGGEAGRRFNELETISALGAFVNRDPLPTEREDADQILVRYQGYPLGHAIVDEGKLLSRFPRIGWRFSLSERC